MRRGSSARAVGNGVREKVILCSSLKRGHNHRHPQRSARTMLGFRYLKSSPTTYVIQYVAGKAVREGPALSFYYFVPRSVIVQVPLSSVDVPFVFNEVT